MLVCFPGILPLSKVIYEFKCSNYIVSLDIKFNYRCHMQQLVVLPQMCHRLSPWVDGLLYMYMRNILEVTFCFIVYNPLPSLFLFNCL